MIRLFDLNACEWRVYPDASHVPANGNFRDEQGKRWVAPAPAPAIETDNPPAAKPARKAKR